MHTYEVRIVHELCVTVTADDEAAATEAAYEQFEKAYARYVYVDEVE